MALYEKICEYCGKKFQANRKDKRFCIPPHKAAFHREGPLPAAENVQNVQNVQPHEQAAVDGFGVSTENDGHEYIRIPVSLYNMFMARMDGEPSQKKSDFAGATPHAPMQPIDPPKVNVAFNEEEARKRSIANTLASMDDF